MSDHAEEVENGATEHTKEAGGSKPRINEIAQKFLADLEEERQRLGDSEAFPICSLLLDEAIERVYATGRIPGREFYADVYKEKPMKITQKVFVPVKQFPKFNFIGKILGPKGNSLRRLQEETQCRIAIKGRNSMRDHAKEEELRNSDDPRHAHLHKDLFLEISTVATPAESYARVAYALAELRKYLVADKNDEVSHEQLRELLAIDPNKAKHYNSSVPQANRSVFDRKITAESSGPKFMNLIKRSSYNQYEAQPEYEEPEEEAFQPRVAKRPRAPPGYELVKVPEATTSSYKRPEAAAHPYALKRLRGTPVKSYKPSYGTLINKYK